MEAIDFRAELAKLPRGTAKSANGGPTERQALMLRFIVEHISTRGYAPTLREIADAFGIKSTNAVTDYLTSLRAKGRIDWAGRCWRTIRVLP